MRARYYHPGTAQFFAADPLAALTGQSYAHASDDPVDAVDPQGTCAANAGNAQRLDTWKSPNRQCIVKAYGLHRERVLEKFVWESNIVVFRRDGGELDTFHVRYSGNLRYPGRLNVFGGREWDVTHAPGDRFKSGVRAVGKEGLGDLPFRNADAAATTDAIDTAMTRPD